MDKPLRKKEQNEVSQAFLKGSDLAEREKEVLTDAAKRTGFIPHKLVNKSYWWDSKEIGAFHYSGEYKGKRAVLKIPTESLIQ